MNQAACNSNDVIHFEEDDEGFLRWIDNNRSAYFVNSNRPPGAGYLKLHRAACTHLKRDTAANFTVDYMKSCSNSLAALTSWANEEVRGELQPCHFCNPQ